MHDSGPPHNGLSEQYCKSRRWLVLFGGLLLSREYIGASLGNTAKIPQTDVTPPSAQASAAHGTDDLHVSLCNGPIAPLFVSSPVSLPAPQFLPHTLQSFVHSHTPSYLVRPRCDALTQSCTTTLKPG